MKKTTPPEPQNSSGEESLLEEVCDLDELLRAEYEHDTEVQAKALKKWDETLSYPTLNDQPAPRFVTAGQALSKQLFPESKHTLFPGSILESLQAQSQVVLSEQEQQQQEAALRKVRLDASLRRVFPFLEELVRHLNTLKPEIPRAYSLTKELEIKNLVWQEGRVDYQSSTLHTSTAELESVTLTYRLASQGDPLCVELESSFVESFHRKLFDLGLLVEVKNILDERRVLQRAKFTIQPEIRTQVRWRGNPEDGRLRCETNNLERFGRLTWLFSPDAPMDTRFLNEFGRLILGQEHDFPYILNRESKRDSNG